jgi:hypothetical protein
MKFQKSVLSFTIPILSILLSACQAAATPTLPPIPSPTPIQPTETRTPYPTPAVTTPPPPEFYFAWHDWWVNQTPLPTTAQGIADVAAAQEAIEIYYHLMEEKDYVEAYSFLSPSTPRLQSKEEWVEGRELMVESLELLSVQHYPAFQATVNARHEDEPTPIPFYESEQCKVFVVKINIDYIGGWGAEPSGEDSSFVIAVKEKDEWRLVGIYSGVGRDACRGY